MVSCTGMNKLMFYVDVDGVINNLRPLPEHDCTLHQCKAYTIAVPYYMPALMQALRAAGDVRWLTTWRDDANKWISPLIDWPQDIPVITDGTRDRHVDWKYDAGLPQAEEDAAAGYDIYWIEDFGHAPFHPIFDIVTPVDTASAHEYVLLPQHLPGRVQRAIEPFYDGPRSVEGRVRPRVDLHTYMSDPDQYDWEYGPTTLATDGLGSRVT